MNTNYPFISVILPIRNEEDKILSTLNSILNQNYKSDKIEILISDGSSYDNTIKIINNIANQDPRIKIIKNIYKIVSTGFNLALNDAKGDIIIRIDGHCEITQNYFEKCCNLLKETDADIVGGVIQTISSGLIGNAISIAQSSPFGVGGVKFRRIDLDKGSYVDTLAFGAHRRELFVDIGSYDEEMVCNQDDEFNNRVLQAEKKIWMDPTIRTKYYARSSYFKLFKQYFNYGFYKVRGIQKRKRLFSIRHLAPSTFLISLIGTSIFGYFLHLPWISFSVIFLYLIVNFISSIIVSQKTVQIPLIFLSFWILHIGYGLGFIWGLICFSGKWRDNSLKDNHFNREQFIANGGVSI